MGDESVWKTMVPLVNIKRRGPRRHVPTVPTAYFIDSHWRAQKAYSSKVFDPWDHYQRKGTHGFCQTFCMMYLLDQLPEPSLGYQDCDRSAREFILRVLKDLPDSHPSFAWDSREKLLKTLHVK
jgi:hypothetical protein